MDLLFFLNRTHLNPYLSGITISKYVLLSNSQRYSKIKKARQFYPYKIYMHISIFRYYDQVAKIETIFAKKNEGGGGHSHC